MSTPASRDDWETAKMIPWPLDHTQLQFSTVILESESTLYRRKAQLQEQNPGPLLPLGKGCECLFSYYKMRKSSKVNHLLKCQCKAEERWAPMQAHTHRTEILGISPTKGTYHNSPRKNLTSSSWHLERIMGELELEATSAEWRVRRKRVCVHPNVALLCVRLEQGWETNILIWATWNALI